MPVSRQYRDFVLEQFGRVVPVTSRAMFGGVGIYSDGLFFALLDDDRVYLKVDATNRPDFERAGMGPFQPYGDGSKPMTGYSELPAELLEDPHTLRPWVEKSLDVARRGRRKRARG